jgi:hypothetical protein
MDDPGVVLAAECPSDFGQRGKFLPSVDRDAAVLALRQVLQKLSSCLYGCLSSRQGWWSGLGRRLREIRSTPYLVVGCGLVTGSEAEKSLERGHRLLSPVMAKNELVQINLQLIAAHAMAGADEALLEVADGPVRRWRFAVFAPTTHQAIGPTASAKYCWQASSLANFA